MSDFEEWFNTESKIKVRDAYSEWDITIMKAAFEAGQKSILDRVPKLEQVLDVAKLQYHATFDHEGNHVLRHGHIDFIDGANLIQYQITQTSLWDVSKLKGE
jgi:hypothetical protein